MADKGVVVERHPRICAACKLFKPDATCSAFPGGIPDPIFWEGKDHRTKAAGQKNDVVFELEPGKEDDLAYYEAYGSPEKQDKIKLAAEALLDLLHGS